MPQPRSRRVAHFYLLAVTLLAVAFGASLLEAQTGETFKARLSPVPINVGQMAIIAGFGSLTATLTGKQLAIQGTFDGLKSSATSAQIHRSPKGIPGPAIANFQLMVTNAAKGSISGTIELSPDQIADLRNGLWYVQIQSERAPDGNLWGWLLR